jgi:hypothetical protein
MNADELEYYKIRDRSHIKIIKVMAEQITKYEQVLQSIANEQVELSHDKIKWQCEDHIRWAKEALSLSGNNAQSISDDDKTLPKGK